MAPISHPAGAMPSRARGYLPLCPPDAQAPCSALRRTVTFSAPQGVALNPKRAVGGPGGKGPASAQGGHHRLEDRHNPPGSPAFPGNDRPSMDHTCQKPTSPEASWSVSPSPPSSPLIQLTTTSARSAAGIAFAVIYHGVPQEGPRVSTVSTEKVSSYLHAQR